MPAALETEHTDATLIPNQGVPVREKEQFPGITFQDSPENLVSGTPRRSARPGNFGIFGVAPAPCGGSMIPSASRTDLRRRWRGLSAEGPPQRLWHRHADLIFEILPASGAGGGLCHTLMVMAQYRFWNWAKGHRRGMMKLRRA